MKQFLVLFTMILLGGVGSLIEPFWGVLLYYTFAVWRPQYMWAWALPVELRWSLFAAVIAIVSVGLNLSRISLMQKKNLVLRLMLVYGFLLLMSLLTANDPVIAQRWGIEYAKILLMAVVASLVVNKMWHVRAMAVMILIALGYVAWEVNYLYLFDGRLDIYHIGYGGLDNNGAALMLAMGIPFAFVFCKIAKKWWQVACSGAIGLLLLHAVLMSYSRGAMLATVVGVVWLLIHHRSRMQAAGIALLLCLAVSVLAGKEIRQRFVSIENFQHDVSAQSRFDSWAAAWELAWERPLTGQGIRNSSLIVHSYGADRQGRTIHSQYLQIAADSGIPAMIVYITMLGVAMVYLQRTRQMCVDRSYCGRTIGSGHETDGLVDQIGEISLACQSSMIIFAFGGVFLSLEVLEISWLMMVLAGVLPGLVERHLTDEAQEPDRAPTPPHHDWVSRRGAGQHGPALAVTIVSKGVI